MMEYQDQLKLQAYLDGELPETEAREVANWLARDRDAVALLAELRNTRQALGGFEKGIHLPESREFYWSKIQREIQRLEPALEPRSEAALPLALRLRRWLVPASAIAVLALAGLFALRPSDAVQAETAVADSGAFTYYDYSAGATLVWLSYPAENTSNDPNDEDLTSLN